MNTSLEEKKDAPGRTEGVPDRQVYGAQQSRKGTIKRGDNFQGKVGFYGCQGHSAAIICRFPASVMNVTLAGEPCRAWEMFAKAR